MVLPPNTERQRYLVLATQRAGGGGGGEHGGVRPGAPLRNSAGEYNYPATPQDSPDRRRVVSAPNTHLDYGDPPRWSHEGLGGYPTTPGAPYPPSSHPSQRPALVRPGHHGSRGLADLPDYSHLVGKGMGEQRDRKSVV